MIYKKDRRLLAGLILALASVATLAVLIFVKFIKPSAVAIRDIDNCRVKVDIQSDDCNKTCLPESDKLAKCTDQSCRNQASLLLNYCSERCRASAEAEINRCNSDLEKNSPIRRLLRQNGL